MYFTPRLHMVYLRAPVVNDIVAVKKSFAVHE